VLQVATDAAASGIREFLLDFPSPRHLSSSGSYPLNLAGLGDPTGSNATAGLALMVTGNHKLIYHGKVEIPIKGLNFHACENPNFLLYFPYIRRGSEISLVHKDYQSN
jgi:hypothetical protein